MPVGSGEIPVSAGCRLHYSKSAWLLGATSEELECKPHIPAKVPRPSTIMKDHFRAALSFALSALNMMPDLSIIAQNTIK